MPTLIRRRRTHPTEHCAPLVGVSESVEEARTAASDETVEQASKPISLRANLVWMMAARVVYNGCQWGMLATFAALGDPTVAGLFVLAIAVTGPIFMFANLQLRIAQATDRAGENRFADYRSVRFATTAVAILAAAAFALITEREAETLFAIAAVGLAKAIESISDVYFGVLQRNEAIRSIATSLIIKGPLSLAAVVVVFSLTHSVGWAALGMAGVWLALLLAYDIPVTSRFLADEQLHSAKLSRDRVDQMLRIARKALPLGIATGLLSLEVNVPRYVVEAQYGRAALGIFGSVAYLILVGQTIVQSLAYTIIPRLARHHQLGQRQQFCRVLGLSTGGCAGLGVVFVAGTAIAGLPVVTIVYGQEYATSQAMLVWIAIAAGLQFVNFTMSSALRAMRQFRTLFGIQIVSLATIAAACWWGGQQSGLTGVAVGMAACGIVNTLMLVGTIAPLLLNASQWSPQQSDTASTSNSQHVPKAA